MSINGVSMIIGLASGLIYVSQCGNNSYTMLWQPFQLIQRMTHTLPHHETERQWSVNNIWFCILGNQCFTRINELRTKLLTAFIAKNTTYNRKNSDSKIINVTDCKTCKNRLLAVENLILIIYKYPTAKTQTIYKSTDGPGRRPAENPPSPDGLGEFHRTLPELMVPLYWQPGPAMWQWFVFDLDPHPKWWSRTVGNTTRWSPQFRSVNTIATKAHV